VLNSTISSVSAGSATLAATAGTSIAGTATATWGTDDSAAFTTEVAALAAAGGGTLNFYGTCVIASSITWPSHVSLNGQGAGKSVLKWISTSSMTAAVISGLSGSTSAPYVDNQFKDFEIDVEAATQASYNVAGKAFFFQFMTRPLVSNLYVHGAPATCIGIDHLQAGRIVNNVVANCGRLNASGSTNPGGAGIGVGTYSTAFSDGSVISGNTVYFPATAFGHYGIFVESQVNQSVASWNRIEGNLVYLYATGQYGIGVSGVYSTLVANNTINGTAGIGTERGISIDLGTLGPSGVASADPYGKYIGNVIRNVDIGIFYDGSQAAQVTPNPVTIENNTITGCVRYGIWLHGGAVAMDSMTINGGVIWGCNSAGILVDGAGGSKNLLISNMKIFNNALTTGTATLQGGISIAAAVNRLTMFGNDIYDGGSTKQKYAIIINGVAVTNAMIDSSLANNLAANATGTILLSGGGTCAGVCGP